LIISTLLILSFFKLFFKIFVFDLSISIEITFLKNLEKANVCPPIPAPISKRVKELFTSFFKKLANLSDLYKETSLGVANFK
jgi:hypothetical protein